MFSRLKSVVSGAVEGLEGPRSILSNEAPPLRHKHKYSRPAFLNLSDEAIIVTTDKRVRPVLSSSSSNPLPYNAGYAECVNAGKSNMNEDMAQVYVANIKCVVNNKEHTVHYAYYGLFDGHAGYGAALDASKQLHHIIHQKLVDSMDAILAASMCNEAGDVDKKSLIIGALETSFVEMDEVIKESKNNYLYPGGCTAIVSLFIFDELYVANAGDCRAGICDNFVFVPMTNDFSPTHDKSRIYTKAWENPQLLGNKYTTRDFIEPPTKEDLGKIVLYRDPYMSGWSFKTLGVEDLKVPLISGVGRKSRIMGTIGVARGFGDFELTATHNKIPIKPFLSCIPEVKIFSYKDLTNEDAVLVIASDGLWDAVDTSTVVYMCSGLDYSKDRNVYITTAMNLVAAARGRKDLTTNMWMLKNLCTASLDDITVFVIPVGTFFSKNNCDRSSFKQTEAPARCDTPMEVSDTESGSTPPGSPKTKENNPECDETKK